MSNASHVTPTSQAAAADIDPRAVEPSLRTDLEPKALRDTTQPVHGKPRRAAGPNGFATQRTMARESRRRILQAATVLWAEHGIIGDSLGLLAKRAGVSHATVYNQMGNREEMLTQILTDQVARLTQSVRAAADAAAEAPAAAKLEAMLLAYLTCVAANPRAQSLLQNGLGALPPHRRAGVRLRHRILLELLVEPLRQIWPSLDRTLALALAAAGSVSDSLLWFDPQHQLDPQDTARRLTTMLLAGLHNAEDAGPRPGCGGPVAACARGWLASDAG
jgi:AcrR family transcriptional regulator